jgi:ABC-2 type transport system ATP-binding protein
MTAPAIDVRSLTKRFGPVTAVNHLSFTVQPGRVTGFLGPNGSGKSSTLRTILGLVAPTSGSASVLGQPFHRLSNPARRVGAALEAQAFHPGRTARQHLRILATAAGVPRARVDEALEEVGLTGAADRRAGTFSLGMGQRLTLAAALLGQPELLILDEPANGLDPEGMRWLRALLRGFAGAGGTVLLSSHALSEVTQTVDDVVIISRRELVTAGPLSDLDRISGSRVRVRTPDADQLERLLTAAKLSVERDGADQLLVSDTTTEQLGRLASEHRVVIYGMTTETGSLEDTFLALTGASTSERNAS